MLSLGLVWIDGIYVIFQQLNFDIILDVCSLVNICEGEQYLFQKKIVKFFLIFCCVYDFDSAFGDAILLK